MKNASVRDLRYRFSKIEGMLREGEEIEINEGPFAGTTAVVAQVMPGKERARVLIDVMGRLVPAELNLGLVLFNRRNAAQIALEKAAERSVKEAEAISAGAVPLTIALRQPVGAVALQQVSP